MTATIPDVDILYSAFQVNSGVGIDLKKAYAEFWMGTHESGPSFVVESERDLVNVPAKTVELYLDLRKFVEDYVRGFIEPSSDKLFPDLHSAEQHAFTLVLDLNETLIHSDWNYVDPVIDILDEKHCIRYRLSRAATKYQNGKHYRISEYVARNDVILLVVIPATQTPEVSSSKALRTTKEHDSEGALP
ncbi:hypothetical protein Droror1_Dr00002307 [Drosera rotundifolia]